VIRRYALAPLQSLALVGLALVGLVTAFMAVIGLMLVLVGLLPLYETAVRASRWLANLGRRSASAWSRIPIDAEYIPEPERPQRRQDGWYQLDNQLYKRPTVPTYLLRAKWLTQSTNARDWWWLVLTPVIVGPLVALPPALFAVGWALVLWGRWPLIVAVPAALSLALLGFLIGPAMLRVHALWSKEMLRPLKTSWWHTSGIGGWAARRYNATWHVGGLAGLALGALLFLLLQVLATLVSWGLLLPWAATVSRPYLEYYRRKANEWAGADLSNPYRPVPEPPAPDEHGQFRAGRTLYSDQAAAARMQRYGWVWRDPATWRDLMWMATSPVISALALVPAALVSVGLFGLVSQPLWWWPWALPAWLVTGEWVTPWYIALSPLVGLVVAVPGLLLALPMLRVRVWCDRLLLRPTRSSTLDERVQRLTQTRADAVDVQAAELRRIERDLHDGAQARLVAMGLNLATIEELIDHDPRAARELLAKARESSTTALAELRDLVRGIHPPVLAERGLADAVRAVALDSPLPVTVMVDMAGRPPAPVESAAYFAVNELLANATRHAGAKRVDIGISHRDGVLTATVTDDGRGGADPILGGGLEGIRRRLGTFDGVLALQSPPGGPTVATLEIPCALSSPRTSIS
jgi:signal transduction histidine kinase